MSKTDAPLEYMGTSREDLSGENQRCHLRASCLSEEIQKGHFDAENRNRQDQAQIERSRELGGERMKKKVRVTKSSGNVFADIGLPNAAEHSIKADIVLRIAARIKSKGLTQAKAASLLGLAQPDVSKLLRGHFAGYTYDRLFGYLNALGEKVCIEISQAKNKKDARLELEMTD